MTFKGNRSTPRLMWLYLLASLYAVYFARRSIVIAIGHEKKAVAFPLRQERWIKRCLIMSSLQCLLCSAAMQAPILRTPALAWMMLEGVDMVSETSRLFVEEGFDVCIYTTMALQTALWWRSPHLLCVGGLCGGLWMLSQTVLASANAWEQKHRILLALVTTTVNACVVTHWWSELQADAVSAFIVGAWFFTRLQFDMLTVMDRPIPYYPVSLGLPRIPTLPSPPNQNGVSAQPPPPTPASSVASTPL